MAVKDRFGRFVRAGQAPAKTAPELAPPAEPNPTAEQRLAALVAERDDIVATLQRHQADRERWLKEGGPIDEIAEQGESDKRLALRLEQIEAQGPGVAAEAGQERQAAHDREWQRRVPALEAAEQALADAFGEVDWCMQNLHAARRAAGRDGFSFEIATRPAPPQQLLPYPIAEYRMAIRKRAERRAQPQPEMLEVSTEAAANWWPTEPPTTFWPRAVPTVLMEKIGALAAPRQVRVLHSCRTDNVWPSQLRIRAGEEMWAPARTAWALVYAGVAVYIDGAPPPTVPEPVSERETAA